MAEKAACAPAAKNGKNGRMLTIALWVLSVTFAAGIVWYKSESAAAEIPAVRAIATENAQEIRLHDLRIEQMEGIVAEIKAGQGEQTAILRRIENKLAERRMEIRHGP